MSRAELGALAWATRPACAARRSGGWPPRRHQTRAFSLPCPAAFWPAATAPPPLVPSPTPQGLFLQGAVLAGRCWLVLHDCSLLLASWQRPGSRGTHTSPPHLAPQAPARAGDRPSPCRCGACARGSLGVWCCRERCIGTASMAGMQLGAAAVERSSQRPHSRMPSLAPLFAAWRGLAVSAAASSDEQVARSYPYAPASSVSLVFLSLLVDGEDAGQTNAAVNFASRCVVREAAAAGGGGGGHMWWDARVLAFASSPSCCCRLANMVVITDRHPVRLGGSGRVENARSCVCLHQPPVALPQLQLHQLTPPQCLRLPAGDAGAQGAGGEEQREFAGRWLLPGLPPRSRTRSAANARPGRHIGQHGRSPLAAAAARPDSPPPLDSLPACLCSPRPRPTGPATCWCWACTRARLRRRARARAR